jgi:hypothetical protein
MPARKELALQNLHTLFRYLIEKLLDIILPGQVNFRMGPGDYVMIAAFLQGSHYCRADHAPMTGYVYLVVFIHCHFTIFWFYRSCHRE